MREREREKKKIDRKVPQFHKPNIIGSFVCICIETTGTKRHFSYWCLPIHKQHFTIL